MTLATTPTDTPATTPDVAQEVMGRLAEQVLAMSQQAFEKALNAPEAEGPMDDAEDDEGDDE